MKRIITIGIYLLISLLAIPILFLFLGAGMGVLYANSIPEFFNIMLSIPFIIYDSTFSGWGSGDGFGRMNIFLVIFLHLMIFIFGAMHGFPETKEIFQDKFDKGFFGREENKK